MIGAKVDFSATNTGKRLTEANLEVELSYISLFLFFPSLLSCAFQPTFSCARCTWVVLETALITTTMNGAR